MRRRSLILFSLFGICWLACLLVLLTGNSGATSKPGITADTPPSLVARAREAVTDPGTTESQARNQALARMENQKRARDRAAAKMSAVRGELQFNLYAAWAALITTNLHTFEELRQNAVGSHDHGVSCTICDGRGALDRCIVCHNDGKCPNCKGRGKVGTNEICPACLGCGKCFACGGSGRMTCPFCDDGVIKSNSPRPPNRMPLL